MEAFYNFFAENAIMANTIILILTYIFIVIDKIPKVTVAMAGACATLFCGLLATHKTGDNLAIYFTNFIDFNVIFLLVAMMIVVYISSQSGMFTWIAKEIVKKTQGHPLWVFFSLAFFTAFVSAFLDNVTTVILVMPITFAVCDMLEIKPIPFLITEILASNIGGTATLIGDPPNIIIGSAAGFSFMDFIDQLTLIVFLVFLVSVGLLMFLFRKDLKANKEKMEEVKKLDNSGTITDKPLVIRSCIVLAFIILGFVLHDVIHVPAFLIATIGATILLLFENPDKTFEKVEWNTIFFFVGLFIIIGGVQACGAIDIVANWFLGVTKGSQEIASMVILWGSAFIAGIVGNIPYTTTLAPIIASMQTTQGADYAYPIWWALSLGACLGGNLTAIGAAANVIVIETANKHGYTISFMQFLKYGVGTTIIGVAMSAVYIWLRYLV